MRPKQSRTARLGVTQNGSGKRYSMASDAGDGYRRLDGCLSKEVQTELGILVVLTEQCAVDCLGFA